MQLTQAMDAWVAAHRANLSPSTQRDITQIRESVVETGWQELPCDEVDDGIRNDVIDQAAAGSTLSSTAINEFLSVVLAWEATQSTPAMEKDDGLGPSGAFIRDEHEYLYDDDDDDDLDDDNDDDDDDDYDDDDDDDDDDDEDDDDDDDDDLDNDDDEYDDDDDDYDDFDDDDDDEDDDDDDDEDEDEDEYDDDDLDDDGDDLLEVEVQADDWIGYLSNDKHGDGFEALAPENEAGTGDLSPSDQVAASSFFDALESSPPSDDASVVIAPESEEKSSSGVFSAAADSVPPKPATGIDWVTVAYFSVAAICFGLVIYFYLKS